MSASDPDHVYSYTHVCSLPFLAVMYCTVAVRLGVCVLGCGVAVPVVYYIPVHVLYRYRLEGGGKPARRVATLYCTYRIRASSVRQRCVFSQPT
jgi:hypothetical protein